MKAFHINFLDHVAIRAKDVVLSANWYERVLGLERMVLPEWKNIPVFMSCGRSGVAIFPLKSDAGMAGKGIDHFAFNVSKVDFEKARAHFQKLGKEFKFQDHFYFQSVYIKDPDGHTVELTTLVAPEEVVYQSRPRL